MMANVDDLVTWLRAQLDKDERVAREALEWEDERFTRHEWSWSHVARLSGKVKRQDVVAGAPSPRGQLAEVEAKRRILDLHPPFTDHAGRVRCETCAELCHSRSGLGCNDPVDAMYPCETVDDIARLLAQAYAGREGWREEWQPTA